MLTVLHQSTKKETYGLLKGLIQGFHDTSGTTQVSVGALGENIESVPVLWVSNPSSSTTGPQKVLVTNIVRYLVYLGYLKTGHNFDNYPYAVQEPLQVEVCTCEVCVWKF